MIVFGSTDVMFNRWLYYAFIYSIMFNIMKVMLLLLIKINTF
jgi:hypothetical protein